MDAAPICAAMYGYAKLLILAVMLGACEGPPKDQQSCGELARMRAAGQMDQETALLEQQEQGRSYQSELQRKFIAIDAEAYRVSVYQECLRRRGPTNEDD